MFNAIGKKLFINNSFLLGCSPNPTVSVVALHLAKISNNIEGLEDCASAVNILSLNQNGRNE